MIKMIIELSRENYIQCFWFGLRLWYERENSRIEFGTGSRRDLGSFLDDVVIGKLAELAFALFVKEKFGAKVEPDFTVFSKQPQESADFFHIVKNEKTIPLKVNVISARPVARFAIISERVLKKDYEAYVFVRVHLPKDHFLRFLYPLLVSKLGFGRNYLPLESGVEKIKSEISGFVWKKDVIENAKFIVRNSWLTDPENPKKKLVFLKSSNYVFPLKILRNSEEDWENFNQKFFRNTRKFNSANCNNIL